MTVLDIELGHLYRRATWGPPGCVPWRAQQDPLSGQWAVLNAAGAVLAARIPSRELAELIAKLPDICDPDFRPRGDFSGAPLGVDVFP